MQQAALTRAEWFLLRLIACKKEREDAFQHPPSLIYCLLFLCFPCRFPLLSGEDNPFAEEIIYHPNRISGGAAQGVLLVGQRKKHYADFARLLRVGNQHIPDDRKMQ